MRGAAVGQPTGNRPGGEPLPFSLTIISAFISIMVHPFWPGCRRRAFVVIGVRPGLVDRFVQGRLMHDCEGSTLHSRSIPVRRGLDDPGRFPYREATRN